MEQQTSVSEGFSETGAESAGMDGFDGSAFEAAFTGNGTEDQRSAGEGENENAADSAENQRTEGQPAETETQPPEGGEEEAADDAPQAPEPVQMVFNGQQILLPGDAVQAIKIALGQNPVELLQKGMNYDNKASRELRLIDSFAAASGMDRAQYLAQLEQMQEQQALETEIEKARAEFPDTPDAALRAIAESRRASQKAAEQQAFNARQNEMRQSQERVQQMLDESRQQAEIRAWDAYEEISGVHEPKDIPTRVMELVNAGAAPVAAHWQYQTELLQAQKAQRDKIDSQQARNSKGTIGSMTGAGEDMSDPFLRAFLNG